jgi:hypothetical protein
MLFLTDKRIPVLLCCLVSFARGAAIWTPVPGTGSCTVTAATGGAPVRVTVSNIAACGVEEGSAIWVYGMINRGQSANRSAANIHMESAGDTGGLIRIAKHVNGNSFDLYKGDGATAVAGNGVWAHGGIVARAQLRTTKRHPIVYADGEDGTLTAGLLNSGVGGWYEGERLERKALDRVTGAVPDLTAGHRDDTGTFGVQAALRWYGLGKPESSQYRTNAIQALVNSPLLPTASCDIKSIDCGYSPSRYQDFAWELYPMNKAWAYSLMRSELSEAQRSAFVRNALEDLAWNKGGFGYSGAAPAIPPFKNVSGTIGWTGNSPAISGTGTYFASQLAPGDYLLIGGAGGQYSRWYQIASVASDTALTLASPVDSGDFGTRAGQTYRAGVPWTEGSHVGWVSIGYNTYYNVLCGADLFADLSCPDHFARAGGQLDVWQNHTIGRVMQALAVGLALSEDDPRAVWLAENAAFLWHHIILPHQTNYGGMAASSTGYMQGRIWPQTLAPPGMLKFSLTGSPDYVPDSMWKAAAAYQLSFLKPGRNEEGFQTAGEPGFFVDDGAVWTAGAMVMLFRPDLPEAAEIKHAVQNWPLYTPQELSGHDGGSLMQLYAGMRPDIEARPRDNTTMLMTFFGAPCAGHPLVCFDEPRFGFNSRTGWGPHDAAVFFDASSVSGRDHGGYSYPHYDIAINGMIMFGGDGMLATSQAAVGGNSTMIIGSEKNMVAEGRTSLNRSYGSSRLAMLSVNQTGLYKNGVIGAQRTLIHAKGAGTGYILDRAEALTPASQHVESRYHYWIAESCGTPVSSPCIAFKPGKPGGSLIHTQTGGRLLTAFFGGDTSTEGEPSDGSYPGGAGNTFRVKLAAEGSRVNLYAVHRVTTDTGATMPRIGQTTSGAHAVFEIADPAAPVIIASAPAAVADLTSATVIATHGGSAQLVVDGLAPGTYTVKRNASEVPGCVELTVLSGEHVLDCAAVEQGRITVELVAAAPAVAAIKPPLRTAGKAPATPGRPPRRLVR